MWLGTLLDCHRWKLAFGRIFVMSVEISWAISSGLVSRLLMASIRHSNGMFALCLNIVLCIVLGLRFRVAWYFVMVFL